MLKAVLIITVVFYVHIRSQIIQLSVNHEFALPGGLV